MIQFRLARLVQTNRAQPLPVRAPPSARLLESPLASTLGIQRARATWSWCDAAVRHFNNIVKINQIADNEKSFFSLARTQRGGESCQFFFVVVVRRPRVWKCDTLSIADVGWLRLLFRGARARRRDLRLTSALNYSVRS